MSYHMTPILCIFRGIESYVNFILTNYLKAEPC
jgi:hypothetical protein